MSYAETPALTDTERILAAQDDLKQKVIAQTEAINALGQNVQWLIDQAQGIFKVFSSPQFMQQILSGGIPNAGPATGTAESTGPGPAEASGPESEPGPGGSVLE